MTIVEEVLNVPLHLINEEWLNSFFAQNQEENIRLEFKSFDSANWKKGVSKAICAFANTNGGVIIFGAPQESTDNATGRKFSIGPLVPINGVEKDTIVRSMASNIDPPQNKVIYDFINVTGGSVAIIQVPKVEADPCMYIYDKKNQYLWRNEAESVPAHHSYVSLMFRGARYCDFKCNLIVETCSFNAASQLFTLKVSIRLINASKYIISHGLFVNITTDTQSRFIPVIGTELQFHTELNSIHFYSDLPFHNFIRQEIDFEITVPANTGGLGWSNTSIVVRFGSRNSLMKVIHFQIQGIHPERPANELILSSKILS